MLPLRSALLISTVRPMVRKVEPRRQCLESSKRLPRLLSIRSLCFHFFCLTSFRLFIVDICRLAIQANDSSKIHTLYMDFQLPQEVLQQIFFYLARNQKTLHACSLTSSSWYSASVAYLYESPIITGKNYDSFVRAICPSVNAHIRRNGLAELVRRLDMSSLVHNGSKSMTARLLGRVKTRLEEFVAPQASFAYVLHFS